MPLVCSIFYSPHVIGFFSCNSYVRLWAVTGQILMEMVGHTSIVYSVDAHASGLAVSGSEDCSAKIWKGDILGDFPLIFCLCFGMIAPPSLPLSLLALTSHNSPILYLISDMDIYRGHNALVVLVDRHLWPICL